VICTVKLDEEKSKHAGLCEEKWFGFGSAQFHSLRWLVKGAASKGVHLQKRV
jgi:hypothetical protein